MKNRSKLNLALKAGLVIVLCLFFYWHELRDEDALTLINFAFDGASCSMHGFTRVEVRQCFKERGYAVRAVGANSDIVLPSLRLGYWTFSWYAFWIDYDREPET